MVDLIFTDMFKPTCDFSSSFGCIFTKRNGFRLVTVCLLKEISHFLCKESHYYDQNLLKLGMTVDKGLINKLIAVLL